MSILIRGMRFPKTCDECLINCGHSMLYIGITDRRSPNCPLVEIPTPHGRLIDIKSVEEGKFVEISNGFQRWWNGALESVIDNAPTVIEAEGTE